MGVGIGIGAALLVAGAVFAWRWMRRRAAAKAAAASVYPAEGYAYPSVAKAELSGNETLVGGAPKELGGRSIAELGSSREVAELYAGPLGSQHRR
jgi:hypothetical protein